MAFPSKSRDRTGHRESCLDLRIFGWTRAVYQHGRSRATQHNLVADVSSPSGVELEIELRDKLKTAITAALNDVITARSEKPILEMALSLLRQAVSEAPFAADLESVLSKALASTFQSQPSDPLPHVIRQISSQGTPGAAAIGLLAPQRALMQNSAWRRLKEQMTPDVADVLRSVVATAQTDAAKDGSGFEEQPPARATDGMHGAWTAAGWIEGLAGINQALADALLQPIGGVAAADPRLHLPFVRALGAHGSLEAVRQVLREGDLLDVLAKHLFEGASTLAAAKAATAQELHEKFVESGGAFTFAFGDLSAFFGGLEKRIGPPRPQLLPQMEKEHCGEADSDVEFQTHSYGTTTTSKMEYWFVVDPARGLRDLELKQYPQEAKFTSERAAECRKPHPPSHFAARLAEVNKQLAKLGDEELGHEEFLASRMYTGPLFLKYNCVLRGLGSEDKFTADAFRALCHGNLYTTTLHVINSAIVKLGHLTKAEKVYRGVSGGVLPKAFWEANDQNVRGGVELAFMSTTTSRDVAMQYASASGRAGVCFEIQMGMIDRGAVVDWLSQYPHEEEILFAPLTGLEVVGSRVDGATLIVEMRLSVNLNSLTIEQVVSKRRKIVKELCDNMKGELRLEVARHQPHPVLGESWNSLRSLMSDRYASSADVGETALRVLDTKLATLDQRPPEWYNQSDENLVKVLKEAIDHKRQVSNWPHTLPELMDQEQAEQDGGGPMGAFGKAQDFATNVVLLRDDVLKRAPFAAALGAAHAQGLLKEFESKMVEQRAEEERVRAGLAIFGAEAPVLAEGDLATIDGVLSTLHKAWHLLDVWNAQVAKVCPLAVRDAARQSEDLRRQCRGMADQVHQLQADAPPDARSRDGILEDLERRITLLARLIELSELLTRPTLRPRHIEAIGKALPSEWPLEPTAKLTLGMVLERSVDKYHAAAGEVTASADGEAKVELALETMLDEWKETKLTFEGKEGSSVQLLVAADPLLLQISEHDTQTRGLMASRYAKVEILQQRLASWHAKLDNLQQLLVSWLALQKDWTYYHGIIASAHIQKQIPAAAEAFTAVEKWLGTMARAAVRQPMALQVGVALLKERQALGLRIGRGSSFKNAGDTVESLESLFEKIQEIQRVMTEEVGKRCEDFVETFRISCPRAYFLSNDENFSILDAQTVEGVQKHLPRLFDGITCFEMSTDFETATAVIGTFPEDRLPLAPPVKLLGDSGDGSRSMRPLQEWVNEVEAGMKAAVRTSLHNAVATRESEPRKEWLFASPAFVAYTANKIWFTASVELALADTDGDARRTKLDLVKKQLIEHIHLLSGLAGSKLDRRSRASVTGGVAVAVWEKDSLEAVCKSGASSKGCFDWQMQMRMYATPLAAEYEVSVEMADSARPYGFELLATDGRLVVTPLTERIYVCVLSAFSSSSLASLVGPAGTGKTETVKDLAKAGAWQCVVFNCSDGLDYLAMERFTRGIALSGAWATFDEFNRLTIETLAVLAQLLRQLKPAIASPFAQEIVSPSGQKLLARPFFSMCTTFNPGYEGRIALPDSYAKLFRSIAVVTPDVKYIAEIMLRYDGVDEAREPALKLVNSLKLMSELLSSQDHYDFGIRTLKSLVSMARTKGREHPKLSTTACLFLAIDDAVRSRLIGEDVPIFETLLQSVFPFESKAKVDFNEDVLVDALRTAALEAKLQPVQHFIDRCVMLQSISAQRHGIALAGPSGSGKTTVRKTLVAARQMTDGTEMVVFELNPRAVTPYCLYGYFDLRTRIWQSGVYPQLLQKALAHKGGDAWLVADGPVDPDWMEDLNTLLDDNKKLPLANGEIFHLLRHVSCVFETADFAQASPASATRLGIVWVDSVGGWRPCVASWLQVLPKSHVHVRTTLEQLFDAFLPSCLGMLATREITPLLPITSIGAVRALCRLLEALMLSPDSEGVAQPPAVAALFLLALTWSVGGCLDPPSRGVFERKVREMVEAVPDVPRPTGSYSLYELTFHRASGQWAPWLPDAEPTEPSAGQPSLTDGSAESMIVPTVETVRLEALISALLERSSSVLVCGGTGTGKTVAVERAYRALDTAKVAVLAIRMNTRISAATMGRLLVSSLEERTKGVFGASRGRRLVAVVDDVNQCDRTRFGAMPAIEVLRQLLGQGGFSDPHSSDSFVALQDAALMCVGKPPGGGFKLFDSRFVGHFSVLGSVEFADASLRRIFTAVLAPTCPISWMVHQLVSASVALHRNAVQRLRPTPKKFLYAFNLRHLGAVIHGLARATPQTVGTPEKLARLWVHECLRCYGDVLADDVDCAVLEEQMRAAMEQAMNLQWHVVVPSLRPIVFGSFLSSPGGATGGAALGKEFDVFLSYRVASDVTLVSQLYDKLTAEGLKVWWDKRCLQGAQKWEDSFVDGMLSSKVIVPVLSCGMLAGFEQLQEGSHCDNVLLEHTLALEWVARGECLGIFPIIAGERDGGSGAFVPFFAGKARCPLPPIRVHAVADKLQAHLTRAKKGAPTSAAATTLNVPQVLGELLEYQGSVMAGDADADTDAAAQGVAAAVAALRVGRSLRMGHSRDGGDGGGGGGGPYREIESMDQLRGCMQGWLKDYNRTHASMDLVLFDDAIGHISRLCRVLEFPAARMLQLGVPGSGRQSLTRLAAHICGLPLSVVSVASRWRDVFKQCLLRSGRDRKRLVLLLPETACALHNHRRDDANRLSAIGHSKEVNVPALEDLSEWIKTGDVPGLFSSQEKAEILTAPALREACAAGAATTEEDLWRAFCDGSLVNLQLVLCMPYPSDDTRLLIRHYPSIANTCVVDCHQPLPANALKATAQSFLADDFGQDESGVLRMVAQCLAALQLSARALALRLEPC